MLTSRLIPSLLRLFQNNRETWTCPGQAWPPSYAGACGENGPPFAEKKSGAILPPTVPSWVGVFREWGRLAGLKRLRRPRVGWSSPGPDPAPCAAEALTFQRKPAARVVLPWAGPHHPGHSSGQRGHPRGSFSWKLYPGKGEIEKRAWRW